jgi:hypothetical protein
MFDFWSVMGRMCLDPDFHHQLFERADHTLPFEDLEPLSAFLRVENRLVLGRGDVVNISRIVSGNHAGIDFEPHPTVADDLEVAAIREGLELRPLVFPEDQNFCAAFGLACVDRGFRELVVGSASFDALRLELERPTLDHPRIPLTRAEAEKLRDLVKEREAQLAAFHQANWIIPEYIACDAGFSLNANFLAVSQPDTIALLMKNPKRFDDLFQARVIQGNYDALRRTFERQGEQVKVAA